MLRFLPLGRSHIPDPRLIFIRTVPALNNIDPTRASYFPELARVTLARAEKK